MRSTNIQTKKPKSVFQLYRDVCIYTKAEKSSGKRKLFDNHQPIIALNGKTESGVLQLSKNMLEDKHFIQSDVLILLDAFPASNITVNHYPTPYLLSAQKTIQLDCFELKQADEYSLHLKYDKFTIGLPERENFKLCDLKINCPVEIKINGKLDFSLSSRKDRTYIEQQHVWEYLGDYDCFELATNSFTKTPASAKLIDLRKLLW